MISHLQAAVLGMLDREYTGREIRDRLSKAGVQQSLGAFYNLMSRMEEMKLISGKYENREIAGQIVRERKYRIQAEGSRALEEVATFYQSNVIQGMA